MNYQNVMSIIILNNWGLGIGDWGLGIGVWDQSPIPYNYNYNIIKRYQYNFI